MSALEGVSPCGYVTARAVARQGLAGRGFVRMLACDGIADSGRFMGLACRPTGGLRYAVGKIARRAKQRSGVVVLFPARRFGVERSVVDFCGAEAGEMVGEAAEKQVVIAIG